MSGNKGEVFQKHSIIDGGINYFWHITWRKSICSSDIFYLGMFDRTPKGVEHSFVGSRTDGQKGSSNLGNTTDSILLGNI